MELVTLAGFGLNPLRIAVLAVFAGALVCIASKRKRS